MEQLQPPRNFPASTPEDLDPVNQMERFLPFDVSTPNINRFPESQISPPSVHLPLVNRLSLDGSENREKPNNLPIQSVLRENFEVMSLSTESKFQEKFQLIQGIFQAKNQGKIQRKNREKTWKNQ